MWTGNYFKRYQIFKSPSKGVCYDLAKVDLCFYYKKSIDGIEEIYRKAWGLYRNNSSDKRIKLLALRLAKECNEATFNLFQSGPSIMNLKALEERVVRIESRSRQSERQIS
jgi:hypothetical protein